MSHAATTNSIAIQGVQGLRRYVPGLVAGFLGLVMIYGVGFAPHIAHNVAHDTRHSAAFPCH